MNPEIITLDTVQTCSYCDNKIKRNNKAFHYRDLFFCNQLCLHREIMKRLEDIEDEA